MRWWWGWSGFAVRGWSGWACGIGTLFVLRIEDAKGETGMSQVSFDGTLDGPEAGFGEGVCASDDGEEVDACCETLHGSDFGGRDGGPLFETRTVSVSVIFGFKVGFVRGRCLGCLWASVAGSVGLTGDFGDDVVRVEKVDA
jgi:hypothetical protein